MTIESMRIDERYVAGTIGTNRADSTMMPTIHKLNGKSRFKA